MIIDNLQATVDFWKRLATDQQALKERAEKERDELREERDHLLGVIDEYQEKLRFEGETV